MTYIFLIGGLFFMRQGATEATPRRNGSLRYLFEDYTFDTERRELHRGADAVSITPQVFDLLDYLIRNRERVVSKDDLISAVWNGRIVSDAALTTRLNAARNAIGDSGDAQRLLKTLPRKGFRFVGSVREGKRPAVAPVAADQDLKENNCPESSNTVTVHGLGSGTHSGGRASAPISAPRLSIVVLPFVNFSGDPQQDYFVDGVTESLTTDLSRISGSFVIARNTAFTFKGKAVDVQQVGRELNVRYVLEGSVQRGGNRLRVSVQLIDAETGSHLWAERFDKPFGDLFDMQDEIVSRLANTLNAQLIAAEARRAERSLHPDAMDLNFQGRACLNRGTTPEYLERARGFFELALELDPRNVGAMLGVASVDAAVGASFMTDDGAARFAAAEAASIKALSLAPNLALAHICLGFVQMFTNRADQGIGEYEQALALDRNLADAHALIGFAKYFLGRGAETETHIQEAFRLSPRDTLAPRWMVWVGFANVQLGAYTEAVTWLRRGLDANRNYSAAHFVLAAALARLAELDEARAAVHAGLALDPNFSIRRFRGITPSDHPAYLAGRDRTYEGMRMAGVPEG